ncbi:MAG: hypothetical protein V3V56_09870 [bacterium]
MLGIAGFVFLVLGFCWSIEFLWDFRIEGVPYLYPFDEFIRRMAGSGLLLAGVVIEWILSRRRKRRHHDYS